MGNKRKFDEINTTNQSIAFNAAAKATKGAGTQPEITAEELKERQEEMRTQGRKGAKAIRINLAFTPRNHDFIRTMCFVNGQNMTQFVNHIIERYREEYGDEYKEILEIREKTRQGLPITRREPQKPEDLTREERAEIMENVKKEIDKLTYDERAELAAEELAKAENALKNISETKRAKLK